MDQEFEGFTSNMVNLANRAINGMNEYFDGKRHGTDMINQMAKMINTAAKVLHMKQHGQLVRNSQAIRLLPFIPKENRSAYIEMTNPQMKPLLLAKPEKKK